MKIYNGKLLLELEGPDTESITIEDRSIQSLDQSGLESTKEISTNDWDLAYAAKNANQGVKFAEPDLNNKYQFENRMQNDSLESSGFESAESDTAFESEWPYPKDSNNKAINSIWHLGEDFSQLKSARDSISSPAHIIRIAHFDTGYDPAHTIYADDIMRHDLERNFVEEDDLPFRAVDNYSKGAIINTQNPGHGTGTLSILAGKPVNLPMYNFNDSIGLAKGIEIVPIRLAKSVILFKNSAFIKALEYIISLYDDPHKRCHIVTMSMGGLASKAWADVVNQAYDKGIFIVTASGNNFGRLTPRTVIYPARFRRVVAACGVTYDFSPYYKEAELKNIKTMQGNFGPRKIMRTAIAAFTPNVPWARIGSRDVVSLAGAGTSSATPQVASAAAIYYQKYHDELEALPEGWMKVEAIRNALFKSAAKKIASADNDVELYFGTGVLQARKMLDIKPDIAQLEKEKEDKVSWPLFKLLTDTSFNESLIEPSDADLKEMYETEIIQLIQQSKDLQELLHHEEKEVEDLTDEEKRRFAAIILSMPEASEFMKNLIRRGIA